MTVAINGHDLAEVAMPLVRTSPTTVSWLKYPAHRVRVDRAGSFVTLTLPAFLALELYRRGILPQDPEQSVSVRLGGWGEALYRVADFRYAASLADQVYLILQRMKVNATQPQRDTQRPESST